MTRPLRLEFPGALYHVTSRGNRRTSIYLDDHDRRTWLDILREVCARNNFIVHAYCQMTDHFHLMVETVDGNLARGMRQLNANYAQRLNRKHELVGHVLQGRYKAILVQKESYLLELARYIVLNPVRAGITASPDAWEWSSYNATLGSVRAPEWLATTWLRSQFDANDASARRAYQQFVLEGIGVGSPLSNACAALILGQEPFIESARPRLLNVDMASAAKRQRQLSAMSLKQYGYFFDDRAEAMARAYRSTAYTMSEIGAYFGVSSKTVSRAVRKFEGVWD